ncbi:MAG TPA: P-loop NTPase [Candidatus Dormibacteraeota bacterium]|nr:P-loop NTPase [Candidatus Dormibacteraeota bacterium]
MSEQELPPPERLFTWVDVEELLAALAEQGRWPDWLSEADAFWDGLKLYVDPGTSESAVVDWLEVTFGDRLGREPLTILLEDRPGREPRPGRMLPVSIAEERPQVRRMPRFRERRTVPDLAHPLPRPQVETFVDEVQVVALHAFKGGVGRTLLAVALATALADRGVRVLLVDADLEAPGITWMLEAQGQRLEFAYEDFLALLHGSEEGTEALELGGWLLPNQMRDGIVVMPATRRASVLRPPRIEPVDLLTPQRSPYVVTESLARLAAAVGARVVVVDLRAGASELSAPILLDPRVQRVFVTTLSGQALRATLRLMGEISRRAPSVPETDPPSVAVLTQFRELLHETAVRDAAAQLRDALAEMLPPAAGEGEDQVVDADLSARPLLVPFSDHLLALPAPWDEVVALVRRSGLGERLEELAESIRSAAVGVEEVGEAGPPAEVETLRDRRRRLAERAAELVLAETATVGSFLPTTSLRNLLSEHRTEPPIAVVVGVKGSGKTFTFLQMTWRERWAEFGRAAGLQEVSLEARFCPVLWSANLSDEALGRLQRWRGQLATDLGGPPATALEIRDLIKERLAGEGLSDRAWRQIWLRALARAAGLEVGSDDAEQRLTELARAQSLVFLVDGLEDLFQDFDENTTQQQALRVLLTDCLDWLHGLRGRPLGLLVFVRRDLVHAAIRQNVAQFLARYGAYELRWNPEEALRLALWVCHQAGAIPDLDWEEVAEASQGQLAPYLEALWGVKMGGPRSREARSTQWFQAALSDFNREIQARDVVSFLAEAAKLSIPDERWSDRLLAPAAMRQALIACSQAKIRAVEAENPVVGRLLAKLRGLSAERRKIPFLAETVGLKREDLDILGENGVVYRDEDQYWIPEIFRHGLDFRVTGRPRILAIARLVRGRGDRG